MTWTIVFHKKAIKQLKKLPQKVILLTQLLVQDLEMFGPYLANQWPNFGKLNGKQNEGKYHCHLIKGNPTYVACWEIVSKIHRTIEVYYVGTHENAPY